MLFWRSYFIVGKVGVRMVDFKEFCVRIWFLVGVVRVVFFYGFYLYGWGCFCVLVLESEMMNVCGFRLFDLW